MVPKGLAMPRPAISGAEPWIGSYNAVPVPMEADGKRPSEPDTTAPSSLKISPNKLVVTITSNWPGLTTSCIAVLSTYK